MLSNFALLGLSGVSGFVVIVGLLAIFVFEIAMFVSVIRNQYISGNAKAWWIVGMVLVHPIVAIVYYFTDRKKIA